eukprot:2374717-Pyramimonas_sp.AAC.1
MLSPLLPPRFLQASSTTLESRRLPPGLLGSHRAGEAERWPAAAALRRLVGSLRRELQGPGGGVGGRLGGGRHDR